METKLTKPFDKHLSSREWYVEGCKRYGTDKTTWKFRCPSCGQSIDRSLFNRRMKYIFLVDCVHCDWIGNGDRNPITVHEGLTETHNIFDFFDNPICCVQLGLQ